MTVCKENQLSTSPSLGPTIFDFSVCKVSVTCGDQAFLNGPLLKQKGSTIHLYSFYLMPFPPPFLCPGLSPGFLPFLSLT